MTESESVALPLGDTPSMEVVPGFEPGDRGFADLCLTTWLYHHKCMKLGWVVGVEPTHNGATIRRLNHLTIPTIMAIRTGLEPVTSSVTGWHSNQLNYRTAWNVSSPVAHTQW